MNRIVFDHQIFALQQYGGISRYFCELAARVHRSDGFGASVVAPLHFNDYLATADVPTLGVHVPLLPRTHRLYRETNRLLSPAVTRALRPALIHRTYFQPIRRPRNVPVVVTVYDMIHELFPQYFSSSDPTSEQKRRSVEAADRVICISRSTANDLRRLLDVPAAKISITHLGFSGTFVKAPIGDAKVRDTQRPYFLYVGLRGGYKNFDCALEAYAGSAKLRRDFDLVTFGGSPLNRTELARIETFNLRSGSVRWQRGSDAELVLAYARAHAFIYPSQYEGFGIPPLEAMSCGCPVACSNTSSVPEVVGEAGEYFDPTSVDSIRAALERLAYDEERRRTLVELGHAQCQQFSWDRCADETLEVYRDALNR